MTPRGDTHLKAVPVPDPGEAWSGVTPPSQAGAPGRSLADVVVDLGFVDRERGQAATEAAQQQGVTVARILADWGILSPDQLARATAERFGLNHLDLSLFKVDMGAANLINPSAAKRYEAVPVAFADERTLLVAMVDPANVLAVDDIAIMTGMEVRPAVASREDVGTLIARLNRFDDAVAEAVEEEQAGAPEEITDLRESADDAPVIKLVHSIIGQAAEQGASDIHFEPDQGEMSVRYRIDGVLVPSTTVPSRMVPGVLSRIKIMADLDIAERRIPQDGRVGLTIEGRHVDVRVVTLPVVHGEAAVLRILDKDSVVMELESLGMLPVEHDRFKTAFSQAYGAVLVTGPTGSGKSTTLYGALNVLNTRDKNIITIEDPVEYQLQGVKQVQINPKAGLTFATGLRSMMRADPDIIMVGEIRDRETAQIAVEAALTGHLVLSTLHTNDAPTAITRLIEMGVEPFLVASAIDCVVAQRLARRLCSGCKKAITIPVEILRDHAFRSAEDDIQAYEPVGCARCGGSGYKGRVGLYEVMPITEEIRKMAIARSSADVIAEHAMAVGMSRLRDDGFEKVKQGLTSIAEVVRVAGGEAF